MPKLTGLVYESASGLVRGQFKDVATDTGIQPATLRVFIYDQSSLTTILADIALSPVSTYVDASGNLTYYISAANNTLIGANNETETHVIRFTWTWTAQAATQTGIEELEFNVFNLRP